ncbi:hypothetical protein DXG01_016648 [Tephrocybe rancida]|nr:hypothetical protein DXG01_016648 [Tephrocybe rancida]
MWSRDRRLSHIFELLRISSSKYSPEQIVALAKKLSSKVSSNLTRYAADYPKDSASNKDRSVLKERVADLHSITVKVRYEDIILSHEPFCEQMFQLSKFVNDLCSDCDQARQDFSFSDSHTHIYRCLKGFKENRKAEAEKAAKAAAEKLVTEKKPPAKRFRHAPNVSPRNRLSTWLSPTKAKIPKWYGPSYLSSILLILRSIFASFQTGVEFLPKCKYCTKKHNPTECPGQVRLQETIANAYRQFDRLIPHTPVVLMNDTPADGVLLDAQHELIERVKGMCKVYEFLTAQRAGLRKRTAAAEHEDATLAKTAKVDEEDTEMAKETEFIK